MMDSKWLRGGKRSVGWNDCTWKTLLGACVLAAAAMGHDLTITQATIHFEREGTFRLDLICDLDALALGLPPGKTTDEDHRRIRGLSKQEQQGLEEALRELLARRVRLRFDGQPVEGRIAFLGDQNPTSPTDAEPAFFGITARLTGTIPDGAQVCTFWASRAFGLVSLGFKDAAGHDVMARTLKPGDESDPCPLKGIAAPEHAAVVAWRYLVFGFEHILPLGLDHILFVLGLYLLSPSWRPLLWQVTAFTVAHSVTLALSMYGVASLPSRVVEPLIALSIAYVAVENTLTSSLRPWRPAVVFLFGLLHGLGFAGVLGELGMPQGQYALALVTFNLGVELGQLSVLALAFLLTGWCRSFAWYRSRITIPASLAIAAVGLYWAIQRAVG